MKNLMDFDILLNEVFYKCWHILEYIEKHPAMSALDKEAICATIMEALVSQGLVDPQKESLDLEHLCIVDNLNYYTYQKYPNVCGIPLWMKEKFRHKCLSITGGIPVSMFLAKPPSQISRYCVYDPNTAVSSVFPDAVFYDAFYVSPTRGIRIEEKRPFVEVEIDGIPYLVDVLTKRIFKSSYFKENYSLEIVSETRVSQLDAKRADIYKDMTSTHVSISTILPFMLPVLDYQMPSFAEMAYEVEKTKENYPEEWVKYEEEQKEMEMFGVFGKIKKPNKKDC